MSLSDLRLPFSCLAQIQFLEIFSQIRGHRNGTQGYLNSSLNTRKTILTLLNGVHNFDTERKYFAEVNETVNCFFLKLPLFLGRVIYQYLSLF